MKDSVFMSLAVAATVFATVACSVGPAGETGTNTGAISKDEPTPPADKPSPPDDGWACITLEADVCAQPDPKTLAAGVCGRLGAETHGFSSDAKGCHVTCCKPLPPPPTACNWSAIGDGTSCIDYATIKTKAQAICDSTGASLTNVSMSNDCAGGARVTKVECCSAATGGTPPAPPPDEKK